MAPAGFTKDDGSRRVVFTAGVAYGGKDYDVDDEADVDARMAHQFVQQGRARYAHAGDRPADGSDAVAIDGATGAPVAIKEVGSGSSTRAVVQGDKVLTDGDPASPANLRDHGVESRASVAHTKGTLPDDFPGRAALEAADITTYAQVRKAAKGEGGITAIPGIGAATAAKIAELVPEVEGDSE